jgi:hypothetical protein
MADLCTRSAIFALQMNQETAYSILRSGTNVFLTGSAGAGKTYVLNKYIRHLKDHGLHVAVTASTGIAATHMNGTTIHSWSGIGVKDTLSDSDIRNMKTKRYLTKNMQSADVLIIDEISMLHRNQLEMVDRVLKAIRKDPAPFGGIQVVFSGDFFQLPPIGKPEESNEDKYAFMSPAWAMAELSVCYITDQYRQTNQELSELLNEIRSGFVTDRSRSLLSSTEVIDPFLDDTTKLFTHNMDVDRINSERLHNLPGSSKNYLAKTTGNPKLIESLKRSVLTPENLALKLGAKVMFVKNNFEQGFMNGTLGEIIEFNENGYPIVQTKDGHEIEAVEEQWAIEDLDGKQLASYVQVPLRLAWAITVHKSQGMTLDEATIDLSKTFEKGQGYVALSRLKDIRGLHLIGFNEVALQIDTLVLEEDLNFKDLSMMAENKADPAQLEELSQSFILDHGGDLDVEQVQKKEKQPKKSTYELTLESIKLGLSIGEIAHERGLSGRTVVSHIVKISELFPETDLSAFKPDESVVQMVREAVTELQSAPGKEHLSPTGEVLLKPVFESLQAEVSYDDIKLAMAFLND